MGLMGTRSVDLAKLGKASRPGPPPRGAYLTRSIGPLPQGTAHPARTPAKLETAHRPGPSPGGAFPTHRSPVPHRPEHPARGPAKPETAHRPGPSPRVAYLSRLAR